MSYKSASLGVLGTILLFALVGCDGADVDGGGSGGNASSSSSSSSGNPSGGGGGSSMGSTSSSSSSGSTAPPSAVVRTDFGVPGNLIIELHNPGNSCENPGKGVTSPTGSFAHVEVTLTPEKQAVGTYPLAMTAFVYGEDCLGDGSGQCSSGGGSCMDGTIAITALDESQITFTISGIGSCNWAYASGSGLVSGLDGTYTAPRCN